MLLLQALTMPESSFPKAYNKPSEYSHLANDTKWTSV